MDYSSHSSNSGVFFATRFIRLKTMYTMTIGHVLVKMYVSSKIDVDIMNVPVIKMKK